MKIRNILLLLIASSFNQLAYSQTPYFKANLIGGVNFCQVDGDRFAGFNKMGLNAGIGIFHQKDEQWQGGFEILYASKGSKRRLDPDDANPEIFILSSQYIEFPFYVGYSLPQLKELTFLGGLSLGVNIGGSVDDGITKTDANFNKLETSINLGAQYALSDNLSVRLKHSNSLFRIGEDYPDSRRFFNRIGLYNRLYMLSLVVNL